MGRTPGSKNGISHTPGYTAVGQLAKERPAIDYRRDRRFSRVDYSADDKALIQRLAERRKNSLSSNAATINAAIQKSKDRLAENRAALAKQQAQALAKAKLQRIAAKQKVAESEKGGTNDWQRMANATASANNIYNNLVQGKIQSAFIAGEVNKLTPKKRAHHSYIDAEKNTEKYKAKVKAKAKKFNDKLDKKRNKRKKAKKGIEALRKYR